MIEFSSLSLHLCARSQAVFGGIHPVKASIYTEVRLTTLGKKTLEAATGGRCGV